MGLLLASFASEQAPEGSHGGKVNSAMAPVFPGWNVWKVWQVKDLPFSLMMLGVSRDRQLQIWVEDQVRLNAGGTDVADPADLKGSHVQILADAPGLSTAVQKESVPGPAMLVDGPADLRAVRFFNKGGQSQLPWPHDESYLLEAVLQPQADNPATSGPAPVTIGQTIGNGVIQPIGDALSAIPSWLKYGGIAVGLFVLYESYSGKATKLVRKGKKYVKRIASARD